LIAATAAVTDKAAQQLPTIQPTILPWCIQGGIDAAKQTALKVK
jgi:hypothetical protein